MTPPTANLSPLSTALRPRAALSVCTLMATGLLGGAFAMEYFADLAPCKLCLWQRWPHAAVIVLAGIGFSVPLSANLRRVLLALCAFAFAATAGIGFYHAGVEYGLLQGPSSCTGLATGNSVEELRRRRAAGDGDRRAGRQQQSGLGDRGVAAADHQHRLAGEAQEGGEAVHDGRPGPAGGVLVLALVKGRDTARLPGSCSRAHGRGPRGALAIGDAAASCPIKSPRVRQVGWTVPRRIVGWTV